MGTGCSMTIKVGIRQANVRPAKLLQSDFRPFGDPDPSKVLDSAQDMPSAHLTDQRAILNNGKAPHGRI